MLKLSKATKTLSPKETPKAKLFSKPTLKAPALDFLKPLRKASDKAQAEAFKATKETERLLRAFQDLQRSNRIPTKEAQKLVKQAAEAHHKAMAWYGVCLRQTLESYQG